MVKKAILYLNIYNLRKSQNHLLVNTISITITSAKKKKQFTLYSIYLFFVSDLLKDDIQIFINSKSDNHRIYLSYAKKSEFYF